jgi:glycosyltransferase 2 family protein
MRTEHRIGGGIWYTLLFSLISLYFIFQVIVKVSLRQSFTRINWLYIGLGFIALFLIWLAKALRMYSIGRGMGVKIHLNYYLQMYLATCFISHITPFSSGGTPLQIYLLHKKGVTLGRATALTVVDLGLNTAMFFVLIPVALLTNIHFLNNWHLPKLSSLFIWSLAIVFFGLTLLLLIRFTTMRQKIKSWHWLLKIRIYLSRKGWRQHLLHEWGRFKEGWLLLVRDNPLSIVWAVAATIIYWIFYLLLAPLIFWAIGQPVSFVSLIGRQLVFNFAQVFIPTPGGSGGSELVLVYLFRNLIGPARVGTFILLWKIYTFFSTLLMGGFFFWRLTKKSK